MSGGRTGTGTPVGPHLVAQPGWMQGRLERRDARGAGPAAVRAEPTRVRDWRWADGLSDSTPPPRPPRARGPCRSRCLTQRSAGRGGAPPHCSTETRVPSPTWDPGAGARGPFLVSGWTRSHSAPRRPPKPPVPSTPVPSLVPPSLVWREGLLLSPLCVLVFPAHCRLSFRTCLPFFCPMVVSSSDRR